MKKIIVAAFLIIFAASINAQDRSWGFSAALQESSLDIMVPIWTGSTNVLAPSIGVINVGGGGSDLRLALTNRIFFKASEQAMPFIGARLGMLAALPKGADGVVDFVFGALGGGEYFFSDNFSVGVEAQLNFSFSNEKSGRFGNPGETNINTASLIYASIYF